MEFINKNTFFVKCDRLPSGTAQQRKAAIINGKIRTYPSDSYLTAKKLLTLLLRRNRPAVPYKGPIALEVSYLYETKVKKQIDTWKITRPDGDNLLKVCKDVLCELNYFNDDSEVCMETMVRYWVAPGQGGIRITIGEIKNEVF